MDSIKLKKDKGCFLVQFTRRAKTKMASCVAMCGRCLAWLVTLGVFAHATSATEISDATEWKVVKNKSGVEVAQAQVDGSPFKVTRGTLVSSARPFDVLAVLQDVGACQFWLHKCKMGRVIEKISEDTSVYYTVIDSPLMLKDRDTVVRSTLSYDEKMEDLKITMVGVEDAEPLAKKRVRVLDFSGFWLIEKMEDERIRLTYQVHMDPQVGAVRAANSTLVTSVLETLLNVDRLAQNQPYVNTIVPPRFIQKSTATN